MKLPTRPLLAVAALAWISPPPVAADVINWNFLTAAPSSSTDPSRWTNGVFLQYNNNGSTTLITSINPSLGGYIGASGGNNAQMAARTGALNTSANFSGAFQFGLAPEIAGTALQITNIRFGTRREATGPLAFSFRSNADNYATELAGGTITNDNLWHLMTPGDFSITTANTLTFRLFGYNGTGNAGANTANWRIDDFQVTYTLLDSKLSAAPSSLNFGTVRAGSSPANLSFSIAEEAGGVSASTLYSTSIGAGSGTVSIVSGASGSISDGQSADVGVNIDTGSAGAVSRAITVINDGNIADTDRAGAAKTLGVSATVVDGSNGSFASGADQDSLTIDFGAVPQNSETDPQAFSIFNLLQTAGFTAPLDLLEADISGSGDTGVLSTDVAPFLDLAAGGAGLGFAASIDTSAAGSFSATYTLAVRDASGVWGGSANAAPLVLTLVGSVTAIPEPGSLGVLGLAGAAATGLMLRRRAGRGRR